MARKKQGNKTGQLRRRARRDVRFANQGTFRDLERQKREARDIYEEGVTEAGDVWGRTNDMLGELMPNFKSSTENIGSDYISQLGSLAGTLGLQAPDSTEDMASQQLIGTLGAGTLGNLAEGQQRNLSWMQSSKRQALYERNTMEKNYLEAFQDIVDEIGKTRFDLRQDMSTQVMSRIDQLRDERANRRLAEKEYQLRKSIAEKQESRADRESRTDRRSQNYATERIQEADKKNDIRKIINNLKNRKSDVKDDIAELRDQHDLIRRNGKWGYMMLAGGEARFIEVPEMKDLIQKKRRIKGNIKRATRKRRTL